MGCGGSKSDGARPPQQNSAPAPQRNPTPPPRQPTPPRDPTPPPRQPTPEPEQEPEPPAEVAEVAEEEPEPLPPRDPTPPPKDQEAEPPTAPEADSPAAPRARSPRRYRRRVKETEEEDEDEAMTIQNSQVRMGRQTTVIDTRSDADSRPKVTRPEMESGTLYTDPDFPQEVAMDGENDQVEWKRPGDLTSDPQLFSDGTTRFDIQQGSAGTCWFLSILAALGDKPEVIKQVIPDDAYRIGTDYYDGVFHCRFFRNGEWCDVYCDDFLPSRDGAPWGARSADPNEMWVSLMEKAFARFHGGYPKIYGGWAGNSFISLTGGVAERVEMEDIDSKQLFRRVKNALKSGSVIACSVPPEKDGAHGLVGGHAYTLTGAIKIGFSDRRSCLMRVRNPWGVGQGEWTGRWSDQSDDWNLVPAEVKERLQVSGKEDGEFWMELGDYFDHFRDTHICNFTPDFDKDGTTDGLDQVVQIFGEWKGPTAAGKDAKMDCQKYVFEVPDTDLDDDGSTPTVIQLMQTTDSRHDTDYVYMKADLYQMSGEVKTENGKMMVLEELTNYTSYYGGPSYCYRYKLEPGFYMMVPHTMEAGSENQFVVRIFSRELFQAAEEERSAGMFIQKIPQNFEHEGSTHDMVSVERHFVEWKAGVNAGGQVSNDTFASNPQIVIDVTGPDPSALSLCLTQENSEPTVALGYKIFKLADDVTPPLDLNYIYEHYNEAIVDIDGRQVFVVGESVDSHYMLRPGRYLVLLFTDTPDTEKKLCFSVASTADVSVTCSLKQGTQADWKFEAVTSH